MYIAQFYGPFGAFLPHIRNPKAQEFIIFSITENIGKFALGLMLEGFKSMWCRIDCSIGVLYWISILFQSQSWKIVQISMI